MDDYSPEKLQEFVSEANQIIQKDSPITIDYMSRSEVLNRPELARLAVGLPDNIKQFRIVKIGNIDAQVDGGTHVRHLKEVGTIEMTKTVNKGAKNRRMYFILR